jgi:polysaccharide export outer membrane protein
MRISGIPAEDAAAFPTPITIGGDGMINITYAGQIRAAGLSQSQLEKAIEKRFVDGKFFRWPTVTINVMSQQRTVTVGGAVRAPGRQPWTADLTLMSALSAAGGPSDFASDKVNVIRNGAATQYRVKQLKKNPSADPKLMPGDQVDLQ